MVISARQAALDILARWVVLSEPPDVPERDDPVWADLPMHHRAPAFELVTGVIRYRLMLDAVISSQLRGAFAGPGGMARLDPKVRAILWLGVYQLLLHVGSRSYATVDSSVDLAKRGGVSRAAGLVNAVLRGVTRLKGAVEVRAGLSASTFPQSFTMQIRFEQPVFPDPLVDVTKHLSIVTSHPEELVGMLIAAHGEATAIDILIRNNFRPMVMVRADDPAFMPPAEAGLEPHEVPGYWIAAKGWSRELERLIGTGILSPQDPTAGKAVRKLLERLKARARTEAGKSFRILDLCAGLGTKTVQLARASAAHGMEVQIVAADVDPAKLERLRQRVERIGIKNVRTHTITAGQDLEGAFDAVLADVPCSNTGVMARRVQARWRWPKLNRAGMVLQQLGILAEARRLTAPGGILVYATCSIDPAENSAVVEGFMHDAGATWTRSVDELTLPAATDAFAEQHDGGYVAVLEEKR